MTDTIADFDSSVDLVRALLWQHGNATALRSLIESKQDWYNINQATFWANWYRDVFNIDTANDFGLAVWGRILNVGLGLQVDSTIGIHHFGFGIWSQSCRTTGAIFWLTRPETIIRSACRGDARKTSIPQRPPSWRGPPNCIISIAQQARPIVSGQKDALRVQPAIASTVVKSIPEGTLSSRPIRSSLPIQSQSRPPRRRS